MSKTYRHYVSLGNNCEVAYQFRRLLGKDSSSFFSWNITSFSALLSLLRTRFHGILLPENVKKTAKGDLVLDESHGFCFHSPFTTPNPQDDPQFVEHLEKFREKTNYLLDKFMNVSKNAESVAYFYKSEEQIGLQHARELRAALDEYHNGKDNYTIIVMQTADRSERDWGEPRIANRYLRRFSPEGDATDGHIQSYDKIFLEFPHVDPMRLAGF